MLVVDAYKNPAILRDQKKVFSCDRPVKPASVHKVKKNILLA